MTHRRAAAAAAWAGAAALLAGFALLSDIFGAFGDADRVYEDYYADRARAIDFLGSYLLMASGLAFALFFVLRGESVRASTAAQVARASATLHAAIVVVAACALLTVPATRWYGDVFSDTGQLEGDDAILAAFAFVLYFVGGAVTASCAIVALSLALNVPGWFAWLSRIAALLLLLAFFVFMPILALPLWLIAAGIEAWRAPDASPTARASA